jgi:hypothetical protein
LAENEIKKSLNKFDPWMSIFNQSRWHFMGYFYSDLDFDTPCGAIMSVVATCPTNSFSLGIRYVPVYSLSFLDVYETVSL